ncbi:hypothetical protein [Paenibacillus xylaniclasticus]|uniref:hypothetical protein n=1 Tax=Paenibacillus xylaniclasticus TaxID=588083 RepID=UPI001768311F|nr:MULTISPECIES: hypothetical protein [Paenibacillus]GFN32145.1 hypothetical protein PCURB6_24050 [Paenibacillus curdlanolyticus]
MDYFLLKQDERCKDAPVLLNVRQHLDPRDARQTRAHLIPDALMLPVRSEPDNEYPDVLSTKDLFLVSSRMKPLLELYEPNMISKLTVLLDSEHQRQHDYYLPIFEEIEALSPSCEYKPDGETITKLVLLSEPLRKKRIARIRCDGALLIVVRLDVAESILRRDFAAVRLERVPME